MFEFEDQLLKSQKHNDTWLQLGFSPFNMQRDT